LKRKRFYSCIKNIKAPVSAQQHETEAEEGVKPALLVTIKPVSCGGNLSNIHVPCENIISRTMQQLLKGSEVYCSGDAFPLRRNPREGLHKMLTTTETDTYLIV